MYNLVGLANAVMRLSVLAAETTGPVQDDYAWAKDWSPEMWAKFSWVATLTDTVSMILWPLLIIVASAGSIYAIVLGVNMARADSTEKREEAKKRLLNVLIGMAIVIGLILFLQLFTTTILPALLPRG